MGGVIIKRITGKLGSRNEELDAGLEANTLAFRLSKHPDITSGKSSWSSLQIAVFKGDLRGDLPHHQQSLNNLQIDFFISWIPLEAINQSPEMGKLTLLFMQRHE